MITIQRIIVLVLSLSFVLCIPIHTLENSPHTEHSHHTSNSVVAEVFAHLSDMTKVPWVVLLIIISAAALLWFRLTDILSIYSKELSFVSQNEIHPPYSRNTDSLFLWLVLHHTSPPFERVR
jgi:hypothetical protein